MMVSNAYRAYVLRVLCSGIDAYGDERAVAKKQ